MARKAQSLIFFKLQMMWTCGDEFDIYRQILASSPQNYFFRRNPSEILTSISVIHSPSTWKKRPKKKIISCPPDIVSLVLGSSAGRGGLDTFPTVWYQTDDDPYRMFEKEKKNVWTQGRIDPSDSSIFHGRITLTCMRITHGLQSGSSLLAWVKSQT